MATRVLVVDDDPRILGLLRRGLGFAAYVVDAAADGEAALASARDRPPAEALFSTIGRVAARGVETLVLAEQLGAGLASSKPT